jgi:uncharacterized protein
MKCPVDDTLLQMSSREGVEIDYCPVCRGVWLDRGELDKIIERSNVVSNSPAMAQRPVYQDNSHAHNDEFGYGHGHDKKKKKESFLGDIFDF